MILLSTTLAKWANWVQTNPVSQAGKEVDAELKFPV